MSFKNFIICFLMLATTVAFAQEKPMNGAEIAAFKKILSESAAAKTLQADFTQYKKIGFIDKEITSTGKLYIVHPDKMCWQYSSPSHYSMIFKSNKIYINDQRKKYAIDIGENKQFERISKLIANGVSGQLATSKEYTVSFYKTSTHQIARIQPKSKDIKQYIKQIDVSFDRKDNQISVIKLLEKGDNFTRFELKNKKINAPINDQVFAH